MEPETGERKRTYRPRANLDAPADPGGAGPNDHTGAALQTLNRPQHWHEDLGPRLRRAEDFIAPDKAPKKNGGKARRHKPAHRRTTPGRLLTGVLVLSTLGTLVFLGVRIGDALLAARSEIQTPSYLGAPLAPVSVPTPGGPVPQVIEKSAMLAPPSTQYPSAPGHFILAGPDAPDPFVLPIDGRYLLYTSQGDSKLNVPTRVASVLGQWSAPADAMPTLPRWALKGFTWAPDVVAVKGGWALYFTAVVAGSQPSIECIGDAFSTNPTGPFAPASQPFICQRDHRGSIDPRVFVDENGQAWIDWKSDDNADPSTPGPDQNGITTLWAQALSSDGRSLLGSPVPLLSPEHPWEGAILEAPDMVDVGGQYWLFFSANWFNQPAYAIGAAMCDSPAGPCYDVLPGPLLKSNSQGQGPGEPSLWVDSHGVSMAYNPWHSNVPWPTPPRPVAVVRLGFGPFGPYLAANPEMGQP